MEKWAGNLKANWGYFAGRSSRGSKEEINIFLRTDYMLESELDTLYSNDTIAIAVLQSMFYNCYFRWGNKGSEIVNDFTQGHIPSHLWSWDSNPGLYGCRADGH